MKPFISHAVFGVITLAATLGGLAPAALAHGVVGDRLFIEPFGAEDANPANEMDLFVPSWQTGAGFTEGFAIEKTLLPSLSIGLEGSWTAPMGDDANGFEQPSIGLKTSLYKNEEHEFITSFGVGVAPPVFPAAGTYWSVGPAWSFAKGFGDLPEAADALRPFLIQGDIDADYPFGNGSTDGTVDVNFKAVLAYSLPYLQQQIKDFGIPAPFSQLMPQVEVDLNQPFAGADGTAFNGRVLPGILWVGKSAEFGVSAVLPLNDQSGGVGAIAIFDLFLDDLFPTTYGKPLFGGT